MTGDEAVAIDDALMLLWIAHQRICHHGLACWQDSRCAYCLSLGSIAQALADYVFPLQEDT